MTFLMIVGIVLTGLSVYNIIGEALTPTLHRAVDDEDFGKALSAIWPLALTVMLVVMVCRMPFRVGAWSRERVVTWHRTRHTRRAKSELPVARVRAGKTGGVP